MRKALMILSMMAAATLFNTTVFASVNDDQVTSQKIREADGTSGQNTNSGSGVKTDHIQDAAITTNKILDGSITDAKISGTISGSKLGAHTHNGADIADDTITDAKIAGPISAAKISTNGLNADTVDGKHASDLAAATHQHSASDLISGIIGADRMSTYAGVKIVHKGAANGVTSFNSITAALAAITDNTQTNPYAILVMPGIYEEDTVYATNKRYVAIIGQSRTQSVIRGEFHPDSNMSFQNLTFENLAYNTSIIIGAYIEGVKIHGCDFKNNYSGGASIIISQNSSTNPLSVTVDDVAIDAIQGCGIRISELMNSSTVVLHGITIRANSGNPGIDMIGGSSGPQQLISDLNITGTGTGIMLNSSRVSLQNAVIDINSSTAAIDVVNFGNLTCNSCRINQSSTNAYAIRTSYTQYNEKSTIEINNSQVNGSISQNPSQSEIRMGNTKVTGTYAGSGNVVKLVNCYDASYDSIPNGVY